MLGTVNMLKKSSKSLSRKELLQEYAKLRDLFEVQQAELQAKHIQTQQLARALSEHINSTRAIETEEPSEDLAALETRLKQEFQHEKLDMVVKLKKLHAINVALVERINQMLKCQREQQRDRQDAFAAADDNDNNVTQLDLLGPTRHTGSTDELLHVLPLAK
ncbi:MAG: hypothetical protein KJP04_07025 [Arenicella sp.]|nr:hypothetical protein [Arenicella sp.]